MYVFFLFEANLTWICHKWIASCLAMTRSGSGDIVQNGRPHHTPICNVGFSYWGGRIPVCRSHRCPPLSKPESVWHGCWASVKIEISSIPLRVWGKVVILHREIPVRGCVPNFGEVTDYMTGFFLLHLNLVHAVVVRWFWLSFSCPTTDQSWRVRCLGLLWVVGRFFLHPLAGLWKSCNFAGRNQ